MTRRARISSVDVTANITLALNTETVVATLAGITTLPGGARVLLDGTVLFDGAVGTTSGIVRIRRDSVTGTLVGEGQAVTVAGDVTVSIPVHAEDAPGEISGRSYVLTAEAAGAAALSGHAALSAAVL